MQTETPAKCGSYETVINGTADYSADADLDREYGAYCLTLAIRKGHDVINEKGIFNFSYIGSAYGFALSIYGGSGRPVSGGLYSRSGGCREN